MSRESGTAAENQAAFFLNQQGLKLLLQNYQCKMGEVDLILQDGEELVFVEVRARTHSSHGSAAETVTISKQRKITKTAKHFLLENFKSDLPPCRFDVIEFNETDQQNINWIKDAFQITGFSIL